MCKLMEDLIEKEKIDMAMDFAKDMLNDGILPLEKIAKYSKLSMETVEVLAREMQKSTVNV